MQSAFLCSDSILVKVKHITAQYMTKHSLNNWTEHRGLWVMFGLSHLWHQALEGVVGNENGNMLL